MSGLKEARLRHSRRRSDLHQLLAQPPTATFQEAVLTVLAECLAPILASRGVRTDFILAPGTALRQRYGSCQHYRDGRPPLVKVRCTADGDRSRWRTPDAIVLTLLHEMAHLKHPDHRPRFWSLLRSLIDRAASTGIYAPSEGDFAERARGDAKLAGSAAQPVAAAARQGRQERAAARRQTLDAFQVGDLVQLKVARGPLAHASVRVLKKLRTRLQVEASDGSLYRVPASLLVAPVPGVAGSAGAGPPLASGGASAPRYVLKR